MKTAVRVFTMFVVFAGLGLASLNSANVNAVATLPSASAAMVGPGPLGLPIPQCGPGVPTCPQNPPPSGGNLQ